MSEDFNRQMRKQQERRKRQTARKKQKQKREKMVVGAVQVSDNTRTLKKKSNGENKLKSSNNQQDNKRKKRSATGETSEKLLAKYPKLEADISKDLELFFMRVNVFPDIACDICTKLCYSRQIFVVGLASIVVPEYLPAELLEKKVLNLCYRCKTHITSKHTFCPSRSYWNNLDPGEIPLEIDRLTEVEKRLLARIVPFVKIVKLKGKYGQYGFRGQSILFGMDVFEVTETLPQKSAQILIVTEHLENVSSGPKEYSISRDNVLRGLK